MPITTLPPELLTLILLSTPFPTHLTASAVSPLWSSIFSSLPLQKSRYVPKFTTSGLPNLHKLLDFNGGFRFTIQGDKAVSYKFRQTQVLGPRRKKAPRIYTTTWESWIDITHHPFLNEPIFSPFITYLSPEESEKLSYGPREYMVLDNFFIEVHVPGVYPNYISIGNTKSTNWSVHGKNGTVRELCEFLAEMMGFEDGEPYEVALANGWKIWGNRWVGVLVARFVGQGG